MNTVIIGGGAAGMMCSYFSALSGDNVVLLEKNEKLGKKMYITGKGRCNLTNDCTVEEFLENVVTNSRFMMSSVHSFPPDAVMQLFESFGLKIKTERGNRVFPLSDKSSDVIKYFAGAIRRAGVDVLLNKKVTGIDVENGCVKGVFCDKEYFPCEKVVVCTGGVSYPLTGSTGDGYLFAKSVGHTVMPARACLCGVITKENCSNLAGLTLKNVGYKVICDGKEIYRDFGELLFTHKGLSGPVVLSSSSYISAITNKSKNIELFIDLKPALYESTLDVRVLRDFSIYKNKNLKNALCDLLPKSLIGEVLKMANLNGDCMVSNLTAAQRASLVYTLKNLRYRFKELCPIEEAIVTGGGVNVKEINPKNMESKLVKGLHFAGEVLDVDALTGGFNLQCAFSSGRAAGIR